MIKVHFFILMDHKFVRRIYLLKVVLNVYLKRLKKHKQAGDRERERKKLQPENMIKEKQKETNEI